MARKVIPDYKVKRWLAEGKTHAWIVAALEREDHIVVTPQAISAWAKRNGVLVEERNRTGYPWRVAPEHRQMLPVRVIQWWTRQQAGEKLPAGAQRRLDMALAKLAEHDAVFHYDGNTLEGWWTVRRREGDHPLYRNIDND